MQEDACRLLELFDGFGGEELAGAAGFASGAQFRMPCQVVFEAGRYVFSLLYQPDMGWGVTADFL